MADDKQKQSTNDDSDFARLIRLAGERPEIPLSIESRVYHRVQQEWKSSTAEPNTDKVYEQVHRTWRRRARRGNILRWLLPAGMAATAVIVTMLVSEPQTTAVPVAGTIAHVVSKAVPGTAYSAGAEVRVGAVIATGAGEGVSLQLLRNESLRIDENTELRIDGIGRFTLQSGRVYADSGQFAFRDGGLQIETHFGLVTDVGTQFAVELTTQSLDVAVREGRVNVQDDTERYSARMGERLTLAAGEPASLVELETHDEYWDWIAELTPGFDTNNRSLLEFLKWAARETGRDLRFESDESRMFAMRTDVHGSVETLTPDEALQAILATTTVRYQITADKIVIED